jgi:hypothetical protein
MSKRFEVLRAASMKMTVFWLLASSGLVEVYRRFGYLQTPSSGHNAVIVAAANTSETSVNFYQTTRRSNPEDGHLHVEITKKWQKIVHKHQDS